MGAGLLAAVCLLSLRGAVPNVNATMTHPRERVQQFVLDNGLQVVWEEDHRQPLVAIEARIKGGLRAEGSYAGTGITHFIEHMLFKGTPTRVPGTIEQEVRRYGGTINAFTSFDTTGVSLFVESRYLNDGLALLADILQHAVFDQKEFDKERAVVISEIQMNRDDPDRRLQQLLWSRHFLEHPYRHPILGYQPLLERLTVKEMASFYASQYQPQHIVVACAGDIDGAAFADSAKRIFGAWPRGTTDPLQQLVPAEPPIASAKEAVAELPVQHAYVTIGFSSTRLSDPDLYALDVLANILGDGHSSRLYETIVRQQQLAHTISAWNYTPYDPGIFGISFEADPDKVAAAIQAVLQVVADAQRHRVTAQELGKAKRSVSADYLFHLQTVEAKAGDLANSMMATGDPLFSRRYVEGVEAVTGAQAQEAARRYLDPSKMTTAMIRPAQPPAAAAPHSPAGEAMRMTKTVLKNGLTVLIGVDRTLPIASIVVGARGGVRVEGEQQEGLSTLVAQLLTKGTRKRSATEIAQHVESLGATLNPFSGRDGFGVSLEVLAQDVPDGMSLVHELVTESAFAPPELELQRRLTLNALQAQDDEIFDVGGRLLRRTLFAHHPYRANPLGDPASIRAITQADCAAFAKRWLVPSNMVVAVVGDIDGTASARQLERVFGAMPSQATVWPDQILEEPITGVREASATMEREQALIMMGFRGSTYRTTDRYALDVMTAVLSGMAGRLFQAVREEHGLSYNLGAVHAPGWDPGYLLVYAATRPRELQRVEQVLHEQLRLAVERGFTEEEVSQAKRYLIGLHRLDVQDIVGLSKRCVLDELYGLGYDAWTTYEAKINGAAVASVNEVAKRYVTMDRYAQVIVSSNGHAPGTAAPAAPVSDDVRR